MANEEHDAADSSWTSSCSRAPVTRTFDEFKRLSLAVQKRTSPLRASHRENERVMCRRRSCIVATCAHQRRPSASFLRRFTAHNHCCTQMVALGQQCCFCLATCTSSGRTCTTFIVAIRCCNVSPKWSCPVLHTVVLHAARTTVVTSHTGWLAHFYDRNTRG